MVLCKIEYNLHNNINNLSVFIDKLSILNILNKWLINIK